MVRIVWIVIMAVAVSSYAAAQIKGETSAQETNTGTSEVRDLLARSGIDQSRLNSFLDGRPLDSDEHETLYRILFRIPRIAPELVQGWSLRPDSWSQVIENPDAYRGEFFRLSGTVTEIDVDTMIPEVVDRFGFSHFYRVQMRLDNTDSPALIAARVVPEAWTKSPRATATMGQRCAVNGMFLKVGDDTGPAPQLVFAADRIAWHPDRIEPRLGIEADHVLLGDLGMDVGLLSEVKDRARIVNEDRECFYQLLATVEKQPLSAQLIEAPGIKIPQLLVDPKPSRGMLFTVHGGARRAIRIRVDDPDVQARFGINHYYELDLLVPLETPLQLVDRDDRSSSTYGSYPVTVCVRHLPKGMPVGEEINEEVRVQAFFLKLWAYRTHEDVAPRESATGRKAVQFSPLLIGRQPQWIRRTVASNPYPGLVFGVVFASAMVVLCYRVWKSARDDRALHKAIRSQEFASDEDHPLARFESEAGKERSEERHDTDA